MIKCCTHDKSNSDKTQIPSGLVMKFENGNSISIQWGYFNYCSNREESQAETITAEIMIADATGKAHNFGNDSVKCWCTADELAKFYNSTYEESKQISFKLLYGGITKDIQEKVPFFKKVQDFINFKWSEFNKNNHVLTDIYSRRISISNNKDMNRNKLFNYLIQAKETERNIKRILHIQKYLKNKDTNLVLYGYDSFLFDFSKNDGVKTLNDIRNILEQDNYPTKIKMGYTYNRIQDITNRL